MKVIFSVSIGFIGCQVKEEFNVLELIGIDEHEWSELTQQEKDKEIQICFDDWVQNNCDLEWCINDE